MCLTPRVARVLMSFCGLSLRVGIIGSIRTHTGIFSCVSCLMARILFVGDGAFGSSFFARLSFSVVMVKLTTAFILRRISASFVTRSDLVMI